MSAIAESDWKLLRQLHPVALDRFCQRILSELGQSTSTDERSSHERYLAVVDLINHRNDELAEAFDDMRRSTALRRLVCIQSLHLLTDEEFGRFTPATHDAIEAMLAVRSA